MAYRDHIPTQDPNKPDEVIDVEASLAYLALKRGEHPDDIAKRLGISRRTFYYRIEKLIFAFEAPSRRLLQRIERDHLADLTSMVLARLDDEASNADFARLTGEARQLSRERRALLKLDDAEPVTVDDASELEDDDWEARDHG